MSYKVFQSLLDQAESLGLLDQYTARSKSWFRSKAESSKVTPISIVKTAPNVVTRPDDLIGSMMLFGYDPKTKKELPYYDRFPLVIIAELHNDGFSGINVHYLPNKYRAQLMDALDHIARSNTDDRLDLSYRLLKNVRALRYFKPCYKRYLNNHTVTNYVPIEQKYWDIALFLPLSRFEKATANQVYKESLKKVKNG